jgi:hypothetical protein
MSAAQSHIRAHRVSRRQPCPVCQKTHGCLLYEHQVVCLRVSSDQPATGGLGGWVHSLHEPSLFQAALHTFTQPSQRLAPPTTLDRIYRALHDELVLTSAHLRHLTQERQLSPEAIQARAYRSWGQGERLLRSRLAQTLYERFGGQVLDVPGFLLREQRRSYLSLGGPPGILLPVRDVDGRVIAHQIRTDDPRKSGKYVWLSSSSRGGPGPGSPMHVSRALLPTSSWRVWLTEGILKADICSGLLQETVLALPGVQADKYFLDTLLALKERNQISELVIALDSDWHTKEPVAQARLKLAELAARHGIPVWLADWTPELKGLDDLLLAGGVPKLTPYQVSGNGKRPFEPVTAPPRPQQKALSLVQARRFIKSQLSQALQGDLGNPQELGILLSSLPGSGKSQILTEVLNDFHRSRNSRRYSAYFVPRHDLAATQGRASWAFLSGRTRLDSATGHTPCAYPQRQLELSRLQIPGQVGCDHCPLLQACKENQTPVPARHGQGHHPYYWGQFQQKSKVRVYPAQHFLTPSLWRHPAAVILDDCDLKSLMLEDFFLTQSQLGYALHWSQQHVDHTYAKAQPLLFLLYEILRQAPAGQPFTWQGPELLEELERQAQAHKLRLEDILDDAQQAEEPDPFHQRNLMDGPSAVPVRFLTRLLGVLHYEWQQLQQQKPYNRRLRLERSGPGQEAGLRLTLRRDLPIQALSHSLLILSDASTSLDEAQRLFPERRWIELKPTVKIPAAAQIIQFPEKNYGKVHLSKPEERQKALALLEELIQRQPDPTKVGLITHQSFASLARQRFPEIKIGHYYGQRGSNEFTTCEVLIIFGTPNPNPQDLERQAEALYWDEEVVNRQTLLEARTFCQSGESTLQTRVRSYADPRLREMLQGKRDEELLQAIFRARPLSLERETEQLTLDFDTPGSKRESVTVYVFSSVPLQGLEVSLEASPATPPSAEPKVVDLHEAAQRIWRQNQQLTDQRLATAARTQRSAVLRWKRNRPRYEVEAAPPPSQGPPACNLFDDVPPELIASLL